MSGLTRFINTINDNSFRDTALNDNVGKIVIDTTNTPDMGWETGVCKDGDNWIIVEEYTIKEEAEIGHKKWVNKIKENPNVKLKSCRTVEEWAFGD